jgi:NAD(P)-dependent dehydrogenase (short-subunit alcohol dehydrogenase family)
MYGVKINPRRLQASKETYNGTQAYAQAKRAQVILTEMWSDALSGSGVTVNSMHPGWVNTPGVSTSLPTFNKVMKPLLRNVAQGADTIIWLAASEAGGSESGRFWFDRKSVSTHISPSTKESPELRTRMWETLAEATGSNPDFGQLTARR